MFAHLCINPLDPYAEQEVLVEFERAAAAVIVRTALDETGYDILPDLEPDQIVTLQNEIYASLRRGDRDIVVTNPVAATSTVAGGPAASRALAPVE